MTKMAQCVDCQVRIPDCRSSRCKSCSNRFRWARPDDPRRAKNIARNTAVRCGFSPYENREWLRSRYEDKNLTLRDIAKEAKCGLRTIARWMEKHNIPTRTNLVALRSRNFRGISNPNWKGAAVCPKCEGPKAYRANGCQGCRVRRGVNNSNYKGHADIMQLVRSWAADNWRPAVFRRDNYQCRVCGDSGGGNLHAHHIKYLSLIVRDKKKAWPNPLLTSDDRLAFVASLLTDPDVTTLENGVTLCQPCHAAAHRGNVTAATPRTA